jgi:hypothetical protein
MYRSLGAVHADERTLLHSEGIVPAEVDDLIQQPVQIIPYRNVSIQLYWASIGRSFGQLQ